MKIFGACLLGCFLASPALAQSDSVRVLRATPTSGPMLDGVLEAEWWKTPAGRDFVQRDPQEGAPATERTEVRALFSPTSLYVAFRCYDDDAARIRSVLSKHDRINDGDQVLLLLDPYHDHRTGYFFITNPHGVQTEGVMYNDDWTDRSWDGYWKVATTRDDSGWTAEMEIPLSTLRFKPEGGEQTWGFNAQRYVDRVKESSYWQPVTRDRGRRVSGFGHLTGLYGLEPGEGLELRPYAVANFEEEGFQPLQGENDWNNLGLDAKYRLATNLTVDATFNPDFAQIEADDEVINLSDYPVYLAEKRPFFLEGASIFDTPVELFYSRRITDPEVGAKVSGKIGGIRLMALGARNVNQNDQKEDFGVLRLKRDIFSKSELGVLLTDKEGPEMDYARLWSADARLHFGDPWNIEALTAQSYKPDIFKDNWAHRWEVEYAKDKFSMALIHAGMMRDFNANDAGWTRYSDFQKFVLWSQIAPRPEKWEFRRIANSFEVGGETLYDLSHKGGWLNYDLNVQMMNYMWWGLGGNYSQEYRRRYVVEGESHTHYDNFGPYNFEFYKSFWQWIWYESDFSKPLAFGINASQGDYREGYERDLNMTLQIRPRDNLELRLQEEYSHIKGAGEINDGAPTDFFLGHFKAEWTLTRHLFTRLNMQYIYGDEIYLTNALLGYNFAPESYFYLVYDDTRGQLLGWNSVQDRKIKMKLSYFVQI